MDCGDQCENAHGRLQATSIGCTLRRTYVRKNQSDKSSNQKGGLCADGTLKSAEERISRACIQRNILHIGRAHVRARPCDFPVRHVTWTTKRIMREIDDSFGKGMWRHPNTLFHFKESGRLMVK